MGCKPKTNEAVVKARKICSWAGRASRADCAIPWTTAAIQKINKNQSLNGQNHQVKAFASFFPVCPFCQLSNDIYYKTFKCQLRSFCGQLYSLSLPINFQQLTMMMICGGGKRWAPWANSNEPSNGQSSVYVFFPFLFPLYFYLALSLSPFIWLNRSPSELAWCHIG